MWPLSTREVPKQFVDLVPEGGTLFAATLERLDGLAGRVGPIVVSGAEHLALVESELARMGIDDAVVVVEPRGRNTAPAVAAAALVADGSDIIVILPSDHLISEPDRFREHVAVATDLATSAAIIAFGVEPSRPDTGYGYIEIGDPIGDAFQVSRFKEKPGLEEAERLATDGRHLWNSGMFVARAGAIVDAMSQTCPRVLEGVRSSLPETRGGVVHLDPGFTLVESISFDHAVMERIDSALVVPIDVGWDDIGAYRSLHQRLPRDERGNVTRGRVILDDVDGSLVVATSRVVAVSGMSEVVVVETPDAVLVVPLDRAQEVRGLAERAAGG